MHNKNNIIYYISVSNLKNMFFNIKYRMYFENTVVQYDDVYM